MTTTTPTAAAFVSALDRNVDAFYSDRVTFAEFGAANRRIWRSIEEAGPACRAEVDRVLRSRP